MDWAKHRRHKAAAKMHLRLNLQSFLPAFAIIEEASHHDNARAIQICAGLQTGEIAVFDKAYVHFANLFNLSERGIFWVTRAKDNLRYRVRRKKLRRAEGNIIRDDEITLITEQSRREYPQRLRRVEARVEVNGEWVVMVFLTNNFDIGPLPAFAICIDAGGVSKPSSSKSSRPSKFATSWATPSMLSAGNFGRLCCFMCCSALSHSRGQWPHSFTRLFTIVRGVVWDRFGLFELADFYGTAGHRYRMCSAPQSTYFPGFAP